MNLAPRLARLVAKTGVLSDSCTILELGCGTGQVSRELAPLVERQVGVDIDPEAVWSYNNSCRMHGISASEMCAYCLDLTLECPWKDTFDAATAVLVLHHLHNIPGMLNSLHKALKPGGALVIVELYREKSQEHRHGCYTNEIVQLLRSLSFQVNEKVLRTSISMSSRTNHINCLAEGPETYQTTKSSLVVLVARKQRSNQ